MAACPNSASSSRSTTRRRCCRPCSRGCIRRSMRSEISYEMRVRQRRQQGPLGGAAAPAVPARARTRPAWCCSTPTSASTRRSWRASRYARGEYVVTLDADLQNPPEEIGKLVGKLDEGYDYVGTIRQQRQDSLWRRMLLQGDQQAARMDHAGADHRPGLHDARLRALGGRPRSIRPARSTPSFRRWPRCTR